MHNRKAGLGSEKMLYFKFILNLSKLQYNMLNVPRITVFSEFSFSNKAELMGMRWVHGTINYVDYNSF
jgi:hypothetical protein